MSTRRPMVRHKAWRSCIHILAPSCPKRRGKICEAWCRNQTGKTEKISSGNLKQLPALWEIAMMIFFKIHFSSDKLWDPLKFCSEYKQSTEKTTDTAMWLICKNKLWWYSAYLPKLDNCKDNPSLILNILWLWNLKSIGQYTIFIKNKSLEVKFGICQLPARCSC